VSLIEHGVVPLAHALVDGVLILELFELLIELLHASSELNSSLPGSLHVELPSLRVVIHHLEQFILLKAKSNAKLVEISISSLVANLGLQIVEDLVVSEIAVRGQNEELY
jgi:hypothetical protein